MIESSDTAQGIARRVSHTTAPEARIDQVRVFQYCTGHSLLIPWLWVSSLYDWEKNWLQISTSCGILYFSLGKQIQALCRDACSPSRERLWDHDDGANHKSPKKGKISWNKLRNTERSVLSECLSLADVCQYFTQHISFHALFLNSISLLSSEYQEIV